MSIHHRIASSFTMIGVLLILIVMSLAIDTSRVQAVPPSPGCARWNFTVFPPINPGGGFGILTQTYNEGEVIVMTYSLDTATDATVSIREPFGTIRTGPVNFTTGTATLRWRIPADGDYAVSVSNEPGSNGTVFVSTSCTPAPDPVPLNPVEPSFCNLDDGRINRNDCDSSTIVYQLGDSIQIYGIHPETGEGTLALNVLMSDVNAAGVPTDENLLLAEGVNPATGTPISLWLLTTGELQINAYLHDGKPYVITWYPDNPWDYERLE